MATQQKPLYSDICFAELNMSSKESTDPPIEILFTMMVRMYPLKALIWDYIDSVLDMARLMRRQETKRLSRTVKELRKDYDYSQSINAINRACSKKAMQWGLDLEDFLQDPLQEFAHEIKRECEAIYGEIESENRYFIIGIQQAMTMVEAMIQYSEICDKAIKEQYGVDMKGMSICQSVFRQLAILLPQFAGDMWIIDSPSRKKIAELTALALTRMVVQDANGALPMPEL